MQRWIETMERSIENIGSANTKTRRSIENMQRCIENTRRTPDPMADGDAAPGAIRPPNGSLTFPRGTLCPSRDL